MEDEKVEGWLYIIHARRIRIRSPRKRYFLLTGDCAACYKNKPVNGKEETIKAGVIHPYTRIVDNGRESFHGRVLFVFTIYDSSNPEHKLKLGARSAEEAASWMLAFKNAVEKAKVLRDKQLLSPTEKGGLNYGDLKGEEVSIERGSSHEGLRLFKETSDGKSSCKIEEDDPAIMAVGVVSASCESIFETVMALGPSRAEWDFCFLRGKVLEHLDGHTDIIQKQLHNGWHPWIMKPRDFVFVRYWRRESDGSYVILYHSVTHASCPPHRGFVRARIKSGGYVISPLDGTGGYRARSLVKHMLAVNWRCWQSYMRPSLVKDLTILVLERIAALREFFKSKPASYRPVGSFKKEGLKQSECLEEETHTEKVTPVSEQELKPATATKDNADAQGSFLQTCDTAEEFFDVPENSGFQGEDDDDSLHSCDEVEGTSDEDELNKEKQAAKFSVAATLVKRFHDLATSAQKPSQPEAQVNGKDSFELIHKEGTLPKRLGGVNRICWSQADPKTFLIRGKKYLKDHQKVKAHNTVMQLVAADWFKSNKREDHFARRPGGLMQKPKIAAMQNSFFFIINFQVPGSTFYFLVLYYAMTAPLESSPLLNNFVNGDDQYRDSRFKLIPNIATGSWIVKQSVGKTACLVGEALEINYYRGENYIELDVNIGSSSVAKGVVNLVFGYMSKLVVELAFLIQANTDEELPEKLMGTCRISCLETARSVQAPSENL
ncbi:hypothetical protein O6H91_04G118000 [Diphasiastrum complanatum]|uniref:Uncharacterized protein n=1 Tax=Diphasiastrum complanatum TaxID=34168 RepID=A0ACC2E1G1_DIPCM|nr:hypothetical protein O6H91_04G118000 [Diphasiastrum complanatum]